MSPSLYGKPPHPPSVHLWVSHCLCVFVLCIDVCVRKRVIEGEKGGLCAAVCTHPHANTVVISPCCRYFMCWECVVLSSHRRSKLLNVKVVLVPWPCAGANMDLGTGAECETFSSELTCVSRQPGESVIPYKSECYLCNSSLRSLGLLFYWSVCPSGMINFITLYSAPAWGKTKKNKTLSFKLSNYHSLYSLNSELNIAICKDTKTRV